MTAGGGRGRRVVVLACGQPERGDDAVALQAVGRLDRSLDGLVEVRRCGGLEPEHLLEIDEGGACVVVDCVVGIQPGRLIVLPLAALAGDDGPGPGRAADVAAGPPRASPRSTHLLPVGDVIALARILRPGLPAGSFVGVGGERFALGSGLSPAVDAALPGMVRAIESEVVSLSRSTAAG